MFSGHYLDGKLYAKDGETFICDFKYALVQSKSIRRITDVQGVGSNVAVFQIEVVAFAGVFKREYYTEVRGTKYMIENVLNEIPINALNQNSAYFVLLELKL